MGNSDDLYLIFRNFYYFYYIPMPFLSVKSYIISASWQVRYLLIVRLVYM